MFKEILEKLLQGSTLTEEEAYRALDSFLKENLSSLQFGALLTALRAKGEKEEEITGFAKKMQEEALLLKDVPRPVLDTCGTGGDNSHLLNISTLAALLLSTQGVRVAKHGNRAVSSSCGSADILELLGYSLEKTPEEITKDLKEKSFAFLFAPLYHPAMKKVAPIRKELQVRTIFNLLGPLLNPAKPEIQLLGVAKEEFLFPMAKSLQKMGVHFALIIHSEEGWDEISPFKSTSYILVEEGNLIKGKIHPEEFPIRRDFSYEDLQVESKKEALKKAQETLEGKFYPGVYTVALNALAAKYLWDRYHENTSLEITHYIEKHLEEEITYLKKGIYKNLKERFFSS